MSDFAKRLLGEVRRLLFPLLNDFTNRSDERRMLAGRIPITLLAAPTPHTNGYYIATH